MQGVGLDSFETGPLPNSLSSKTPESQMRGRLAKWGIEGYFEHVVMAGDIGAKKPDPAVFEAALAAAGIPNRRGTSAANQKCFFF